MLSVNFHNSQEANNQVSKACHSSSSQMLSALQHSQHLNQMHSVISDPLKRRNKLPQCSNQCRSSSSLADQTQWMR